MVRLTGVTGFSANSQHDQVIVNEENAHDTQEFLTKRLTAIKNQRSSGELEDLALIIGILSYCLVHLPCF